MTIDKKATHIRRYLEKDIEYITEVAAREIPLLPNYKGIKVDRARIKFMLQNSVTDESGFMVHLLVDKDDKPIGGVAGYCVTQLLSWDKVTSDVFLFVLEEYRSLSNAMKLIKTYKEWAIRRDAKMICASHVGGYRSDAMDALLLREGFTSIGTLYRLDR